jgi:hypothetical protein
VNRSERELKILEKKLQNAESALRRYDQMKRDETMVTNSLSSAEFQLIVEEHNKMKQQILVLGDEIQTKSHIILELNAELQELRPFAMSAKEVKRGKKFDEFEERLKRQAYDYDSKIEVIRKGHEEEVTNLQYRIKDLEVQLIQNEDMMKKIQSNQMLLAESKGGRQSSEAMSVVAEMQSELISLRNMRSSQLKQLHEKRLECKDLKQDKLNVVAAFEMYIRGSETNISAYERLIDDFKVKINQQCSIMDELSNQVSAIKLAHSYMKPRLEVHREDMPIETHEIVNVTSPNASKSPNKGSKRKKDAKEVHRPTPNINRKDTAVAKATALSNSVTQTAEGQKSSQLASPESTIPPMSIIPQKIDATCQYNVDDIPLDSTASIPDSIKAANLHETEEIVEPSHSSSADTELIDEEVLYVSDEKKLVENEDVQASERNDTVATSELPQSVNELIDEIVLQKQTELEEMLSIQLSKTNIESIVDLILKPIASALLTHDQTPAILSPMLFSSKNKQAESYELESAAEFHSPSDDKPIEESSFTLAPEYSISTMDESFDDDCDLEHDDHENDQYAEAINENEFMEEMKQNICIEVEKASQQISDLVKATADSVLRQSSSSFLSNARTVDSRDGRPKMLLTGSGITLTPRVSSTPRNFASSPSRVLRSASNRTSSPRRTGFNISASDLLQGKQGGSEDGQSRPMAIASEILVGIAESLGRQIVKQQTHYVNKKQKKRQNKKDKSTSKTPAPSSTKTPKSREVKIKTPANNSSALATMFEFTEEAPKLIMVSKGTDVSGLSQRRNMGCQTYCDDSSESDSEDDDPNLLTFTNDAVLHRFQLSANDNEVPCGVPTVEDHLQEEAPLNELHEYVIPDPQNECSSKHDNAVISDPKSSLTNDQPIVNIETNDSVPESNSLEQKRDSIELDPAVICRPSLNPPAPNSRQASIKNLSKQQRSALVTGRIKHNPSEAIRKVKTLASAGTQTDPVDFGDVLSHSTYDTIDTILTGRRVEPLDEPNQRFHKVNEVSDSTVSNVNAIMVDDDSAMVKVETNLAITNRTINGANESISITSSVELIHNDELSEELPESISSKSSLLKGDSDERPDDHGTINLPDHLTTDPSQLGIMEDGKNLLIPVEESMKEHISATESKRNKIEVLATNQDSEITPRQIAEHENVKPIAKIFNPLLSSSDFISYVARSSVKSPLAVRVKDGDNCFSPIAKVGHRFDFQNDVKDDALYCKAAHDYFSEVLQSQFDFLLDDNMGGPLLTKLTMIEYHLQCQNYDAISNILSKTMSQSSTCTDAQKQQYAINFLRIEKKLLIDKICSSIKVIALTRMHHTAKQLYNKLRYFGFWKRLHHLIDTNGRGSYMDILGVHIKAIELCIESAGGFRKAFQIIQEESAKECMTDTSIWPDSFRIKALEVYRTTLFQQGMKWKSAYIALEGDLLKERDNHAKDSLSWEHEKGLLNSEIDRLRKNPANYSMSRADSKAVNFSSKFQSGMRKGSSSWVPDPWHRQLDSNDVAVEHDSHDLLPQAVKLTTESSTQTMKPQNGIISELLNQANDIIVSKRDDMIKSMKRRDIVVEGKRGVIDRLNNYHNAMLPPGYCFVRVFDGEFSISNGITIAIPDELVNNVCLRKSVPPNILYIHEEKDSSWPHDFERVGIKSDEESIPKYPGCVAVRVKTPLIKISLGMYLLTTFQFADNNIVLPWNIMCMKISSDITTVPKGVTIVDVLPQVQTLQDYDLPDDLELVQTLTSVHLPSNLTIANGITIEAPPAHVRLPVGLQVIRRQTADIDVPEFMTLLRPSTSINDVNDSFGCAICIKPHNIDFNLGMEIIYRPPWHAFPQGVTPVPASKYPKGLVLLPGQELIQLIPRFDLPTTYRPHPHWKVCHRPIDVSLPPNTYLLEYIGDEYDDPDTLPLFIDPIKLDDDIVLPRNVISCKFLSSAGYPLPYQTELAKGIYVIPFHEGLDANSAPLPASLDVNIVMIRKNIGSELPVGVAVVVMTHSKFAGVILHHRVQLVSLPVRFELPTNICISPGARLGKCVQLSSNLTLSRNLDVLPWPPGVTLPQGVQLVHIPSYCPLPFGYRQIKVRPVDLYGTGLPRDGIMVELPMDTYIGSTNQGNKQITVIDANKYSQHQENFSIALPPGQLFIRRNAITMSFPEEFSCVPKADFTIHTREALEFINNYHEEDDDNINIGRIDIVAVKPHYEFPSNIELVRGVFTQPTPFWISLPSFASVVSFLPNVVTSMDDYATSELQLLFEEFVNLPFILDNKIHMRDEIFDNMEMNLPPFTVIVQVPSNIAIYSWKYYSDSIQAVVNSGHQSNSLSSWTLPPGHFLIERMRVGNGKTTLPMELCQGVSKEYAGILRPNVHVGGDRRTLLSMLPPGIEIVHLRPVYRLPRGISIESVDALRYYKNKLIHSLDHSKHRQFTSPQLAWGQPLSHSQICISYPISMKDKYIKHHLDDRHVPMFTLSLQDDKKHFEFGSLADNSSLLVEKFHAHDIRHFHRLRDFHSSLLNRLGLCIIDDCDSWPVQSLSVSTLSVSSRNRNDRISNLIVRPYLLLPSIYEPETNEPMSTKASAVVDPSVRLQRLFNEIEDICRVDIAMTAIRDKIIAQNLHSPSYYTLEVSLRGKYAAKKVLTSNQETNTLPMESMTTSAPSMTLLKVPSSQDMVSISSPKVSGQYLTRGDSKTMPSMINQQLNQVTIENVNLKSVIQSQQQTFDIYRNLMHSVLDEIVEVVNFFDSSIHDIKPKQSTDDLSLAKKMSSFWENMPGLPRLESNMVISPRGSIVDVDDRGSVESSTDNIIAYDNDIDDEVSVLSDDASLAKSLKSISYQKKIIVDLSSGISKGPRKSQFISGKIPSTNSKSSKPRNLPPLAFAAGNSTDGSVVDGEIGLIQISRPVVLQQALTKQMKKGKNPSSDDESIVSNQLSLTGASIISPRPILMNTVEKASSKKVRLYQSVINMDPVCIDASDIVVSPPLSSKTLTSEIQELQRSINIAFEQQNVNAPLEFKHLSSILTPWIRSIIHFMHQSQTKNEEIRKREATSLHQESLSLLRQYDALQKKLSHVEDELKYYRGQSFAPINEEYDRVVEKNIELTSMLEILRSKDVSDASSNVRSRLDNFQSLLNLNDYLRFQILKEKKNLQEYEIEEALESSSQSRGNMGKAKLHYKQALLERINQLENRKAMLKKDLEIMVNVVYEDYREYESRVRSLVPKKLLSRIRRYFPETAPSNHAEDDMISPRDIGSSSFLQSKPMSQDSQSTNLLQPSPVKSHKRISKAKDDAGVLTIPLTSNKPAFLHLLPSPKSKEQLADLLDPAIIEQREKIALQQFDGRKFTSSSKTRKH